MKERVLKRCPFCGCYARFNEDMRFHTKNEDFPKWYIICNGCQVRTPVAKIETVMKIWNNRFKNEQELRMEDDGK